MRNYLTSCLIFLLTISSIQAQNWSLQLKSRVELRSWRLTTTAEKTEKALTGAKIELYSGNSVIVETASDADGNFMVDIPAGGNFILVISYPGCNPKKFSISTSDVPEGVAKDNYKPTVSIGGFMMAKPIKGVDYIGLNEPLLKVEYKQKGQNFDKDEAVTNKGIEIVSKIYDAENAVIEKFCAANRNGDDALRKKNCGMAKEHYSKAINLIPGEMYPVEQMEKVKKCLDEKQAKEDEQQLKNLKSAEAAKQKNDLAAKEKAEKEKAAFTKSVAQKTITTSEVTATKQPETKETNNDVIKQSDSEAEQTSKKGDGKYRMPKVLGADPYKEAIVKADNYYKTKRYKEAKAAYNEALKIKPGDSYATGKLNDLLKVMGPE